MRNGLYVLLTSLDRRAGSLANAEQVSTEWFVQRQQNANLGCGRNRNSCISLNTPLVVSVGGSMDDGQLDDGAAHTYVCERQKRIGHDQDYLRPHIVCLVSLHRGSEGPPPLLAPCGW